MELNSDINFYNNRFLMFVIDDMANEYEKCNDPVIRMTLGKSELPLHEDIISSMQQALGDFKKSALVYPSGLPELKEKLSKFYEGKYGVTIPPRNFVINVGTSSIFRNLYQLLLSEGDEVLLPVPYYSLYHFCALLVGAEIKFYKIDLDSLSLDVKSFEENFSEKTKVVVINSPGNPLGNILTRDELYTMDSIVNGRAVIVNDEIYANACFEEPSTSVMELGNTKSTFITTDAFSKAYRMYSRRVGYCIAPDELITPLTVVQHHTLLTVDPVVQYGAIAALDHQEEVVNLIKLYKARRDYTLEKFKCVSDIRAIPSMGSFYITLDATAYMEKNGFSSSFQLAERILNETRVATVPGSDFGLPNTLRLSFSTGRYFEGIDLLVDFFKFDR